MEKLVVGKVYNLLKNLENGNAAEYAGIAISETYVAICMYGEGYHRRSDIDDYYGLTINEHATRRVEEDGESLGVVVTYPASMFDAISLVFPEEVDGKAVECTLTEDQYKRVVDMVIKYGYRSSSKMVKRHRKA